MVKFVEMYVTYMEYIWQLACAGFCNDNNPQFIYL